MPLGTRDFLLILRAKDQASRVIAGVGTSLGALGSQGRMTGAQVVGAGQAVLGVAAAIGAVGAAGLAFFNSARNAAVEYNRTASLTFTQVDQVGAKLEDIKKIGRDVAKAIPAPFEQMQESLYDIFSSIDVSVKDSQVLLKEFARGAVAGQTDVQTAGRASIAIMNAFKIPVSDINRVMDVQFQTVKKGVITYEELASTIGRAIPSAARAGETIEGLGGMIAFLTRNGLSAAMSATSAARALDLLSNPKFGEKMKDLGVAVADAKGNFRPMADVALDLRKKLQGLSETARSEVLKDLTKGAGGTIQAMRFLNLAVQDNDGLLQQLTNQVGKSSGAMGAAYDIMAATPAMKLQLLKNRWEVVRTEIGDRVIPVLMRLLGWGEKLLDWWDGLSKPMQDAIVKFALLGSALAVATGIVLGVVGALLVLSGTIMMTFGVGFVAALGIIAAVPLALAAIGVAIYLLVQNWQLVKDTVLPIVQTVVDAISGFADTVRANLGMLSQAWKLVLEGEFVGALLHVAGFFDNIFGDSGKISGTMGSFIALIKSWWSRIDENVQSLRATFVDRLAPIFDAFMDLVRGVLDTVMEFWRKHGEDFVTAVVDAWNALVEGVRPIMEAWSEASSHVMNAIMAVVKFVMPVITKVIEIALKLILKIWEAIGDDILHIVKAVWEMIWGIIKGVIEVITGIIRFGLAIINGDWGDAWTAIVDVLQGIWNTIFAIVEGAFKILFHIVKGAIDLLLVPFNFLKDQLIGHSIIPDIVNGIINLFLFLPRKLLEIANTVKDWVLGKFNEVKDGAIEVFDRLVQWFTGLGSRILSGIGNLGNLLRNVGKDIIQGLKDGVEWAVDHTLKPALETVSKLIPDWKGPKTADLKMLVPTGRYIMQGLAAGVAGNTNLVKRALGDVTDLIELQMRPGAAFDRLTAPVQGSAARPPVGRQGGAATTVIEEGAIQITVDGAQNPEATAEAIQEALREFLLELRSQ